ARIGLRAGIAVSAGAPVGLVRIGADAGRRIADPGVVTLIEDRAHDGIPAPADARAAGVGLRAGIAVIADGAVRPGRCVAAIAGLAAHPDVAGVIRRRAVASGATADAGRAGIVHSAEEAIVAGYPVSLIRIGAGAARRIADAGNVALIEGAADDGIGPDAG